MARIDALGSSGELRFCRGLPRHMQIHSFQEIPGAPVRPWTGAATRRPGSRAKGAFLPCSRGPVARFLPYLFFLVLAVWIHLSGARQGDALTIYRIGGENLDPPVLVGSAGINFVPLAWKDLDSNLFGFAEQLELGADFIAPVRLDPDVNLTPFIDALGGAVLSTGYGRPHGEPQTDLLRDGDPETAYRGDDGAGYYHLLIRGTPCKFLQFDMGAPLNLRRVRLSTRSASCAGQLHSPVHHGDQ